METFFIESFMVGYLISSLQTVIRISQMKEINDPTLVEKAFPGITKEIIEEVMSLPDHGKCDWNSFFYKNEDFFIQSSYYNEAKESAYAALERENHKHTVTIIINTILDGAEDIHDEQGSILIGLLYDTKATPKIKLDDTESRIKYAKKAKEIKQLSIDEIKDILMKNNEEPLILRFKNMILYYNSDTRYSFYNLKYINTEKPWGIVDLGYHEHIQVINIDKYNRIKKQ